MSSQGSSNASELEHTCIAEVEIDNERHASGLDALAEVHGELRVVGPCRPYTNTRRVGTMILSRAR